MTRTQRRKSVRAEVEESRRSLAHLKTPSAWPRWPYCPLKHAERGAPGMPPGFRLLGIVGIVEGQTPMRYLLWEDAVMDLTDLSTHPHTQLTAEQIIAAGWLVD